MNETLILRYFLLCIFMFIYGIYAHTILFAFIFLVIAIALAVYYVQERRIQQCENKI